MRRLVYAPKVYAYVKVDSQIAPFPLNEFITSGSVERKTGMVSTASLTIRNPKMRFTKGSREIGGSFFKPMDRITIWLERIRGNPVQVFTGYLDEVPYLQLYPGTTTLTASCTLKKLLHTYWDPALPFVDQFLIKYGWQNMDGRITNIAAEADASQGKNQDDTKLQIMQDGSIGNLLYGVLTEVADWPSDAIHIERLPDKLMERLLDIYQSQEADTKDALESVKKILKNYIGTAELGTGSLSGNSSGGGNPSLRGNTNAEAGFNYLVDQGWTDEGAAGAVGGMMFESGMDPKAVNGLGCTGIAQWCFGRNDSLRQRENFMDLKVQLDFLYEELNTGYTEVRNGMKNANDLLAAVTLWAQKFEIAEEDYIAERMGFAKDVFASFAGKSQRDDDDDSPRRRSTQPQTGSPVASTASRNRSTQPQTGETVSDASRKGGKGDDDDKIYNPFGPKTYPLTKAGISSGGGFGDDRGDHIHGGMDVSVPCGQPCVAPFDGVAANEGAFSGGSMCTLRATKDVAGLKKGEKIGWGHVASVDATGSVKAGTKVATSGASDNGACHVHFVYIRNGGGPDGDTDPYEVLDAFQKGEASQGTSGGGGGGGGGSGGGGADAAGVLTAAKAAAFVQDIEFPGQMEREEAVLLSGARSLLNDKQLFPFVEQLSKAAMRDFQSLPNGDFYAFYPDYFGHMRHRTPYWSIDDLEVLDATIQLSDETLHTHVFGVGDTTHLAQPGIQWFDKAFNHGIISLTNASLSGFNPEPESKDNDKKNPELLVNSAEGVVAFLKKYGARPYLEEAPFVHNQFFEIFIAWQTFNLLWSRQFATTATVTFMPELFPGGLVEFTGHDLQVYIESVTHNFSYENGFTTEMEISAPSTYSQAGNANDPLTFGLISAGGPAPPSGNLVDSIPGQGGNSGGGRGGSGEFIPTG